MLLKSKKVNEPEDIFKASENSMTKLQTSFTAAQNSKKVLNDYDWDVVDEYDPLWPNDYEKLVKEKRDRDLEKRNERDRNRDDRKRRNNNRSHDNEPHPAKYSGFSSRPADDSENYNKSPPSQSRPMGAAIAPPPSLQESTPIIPFQSGGSTPSSYGGGSVAAKIMAKYGFRDGQGLGKQEQGMSIALQVEKTSKRGGRIIHENEIITKEIMQPPVAPISPPPQSFTTMPPPALPKEEPSITEIMKSPSKVVLLRVSTISHSSKGTRFSLLLSLFLSIFKFRIWLVLETLTMN